MRRLDKEGQAARPTRAAGLAFGLALVAGSVALGLVAGQLPGAGTAVAAIRSGLGRGLASLLPTDRDPPAGRQGSRVDITFAPPAAEPGQPPAAAPAAALPAGELPDPSLAAAAAAPAPLDLPPVLRLKRGETLMMVLARAGVPTDEADEVVRALKPVYDPRRFRAGQILALDLAEPGGRRLAKLAFPVDVDRRIELVQAAGGFTARSIDRAVQRETVRLEAMVEDGLFGGARRVAMPKEVLSDVVKLLSWDVDFQRDIQPGDRFEALVDRSVNDEGDLVRNEGLLYVSLDLRERRIEGYRFTSPDGEIGYYDRQGRSLRKWLLRTPVDGARLSSTFGMRRHPILGFTRMHKGIDFAAPAGTPIFAAGDGDIEVIGRQGGSGNYVRIRHNDGYSTAYAHLSRFAGDLLPGSRVRQGQVIGYVGSTGLSTGPHLHYEVLLKGRR